jgi:dihydroxyacetone kinase-like protein
MAIGSADIAGALARIATGAAAASAELNAADGQLGDGDLGITVSRGFAEASVAALPTDVGLAFLECAKAFQRVSSSSYGTLVATAFMSAAKATKGREGFEASEIPGLLSGALDAMMARGKGALGDKTVLDTLSDLVAVLKDAQPADYLEKAKVSVAATTQRFLGEPNKLGRARMFGEQSRGLPDPGQLALQRIVEAL